MSDDSRVFDPGLQPERTALAWRRTLLSLTAALLAGSRILLDQIGLWAFAIAGAGLAAVALLAVLAEGRYRTTHRHLMSVDRASLPHDGVIVAGVSAATLILGSVALIFVLGRLL